MQVVDGAGKVIEQNGTELFKQLKMVDVPCNIFEQTETELLKPLQVVEAPLKMLEKKPNTNAQAAATC